MEKTTSMESSQQESNFSVSAVLEILSKEISIIATEMESVPFPVPGTILSTEASDAYQKLDFNSQKLHDFVKVFSKLSENSQLKASDANINNFDQIKLEYTIDLLENQQGSATNN